LQQSVKNSMTVVDVMSWVSETREKLLGLRVNNIYHIPSTKMILLKLSGAIPYRYLVLHAGTRISLSSYTYNMPSKPDVLAMALRKHLRGRRISDVEQKGFDRFVIISFDNHDKLIVELLPRGEIVLVDPENRILQATGYREMRDRSIKRGENYIFPPIFEKYPTIELCKTELQKSGDYKVAMKNMGLPRELLTEVLNRIGKQEFETPEVFCSVLSELFQEAQSRGGYLVYYQETLYSFHPFKPTYALSMGGKIVYKESFNDVVDEFFAHILDRYLKKEKPSEDKTNLIREKIKEFEEKINEARKKADLLARNKYILEEILKCTRKTIKIFGWDQVKAKCTGIASINPKKGTITVVVEGNPLEISILTDVSSQIEQYYSIAKKFKRKIESAKMFLAKGGIPQKAAEENVLHQFVGRKKMWYEKYRWSISRNGFIIIAGKNAQQNESIVRKYLDDKDVFLHAEIHGGPATILKLDGRNPEEGDIYDAGVIAASYSRAWKEGLGSIDVYWVYGSQVSKKPPSGEYISKGGFMIYGKKNYVRNIPLRIAVGIQKLDEGLTRFLVGSIDTVEKNSFPVMILEPGDKRAYEVAKKACYMAKKRYEIPCPSPEELVSLIPGPSRILLFKKSGEISTRKNI
jgi:predicted ribosome quality control (RQC) complex YloA/Tae2 family protein